MRNLNPILDEMRSLTSAREIAMIRRASQIAGLGLMEAMRSTEPGVAEYQRMPRNRSTRRRRARWSTRVAGVFSHTVGMAVHDFGGYRGPLRPGQVFSIDPQLRVPEENLYLRFEDTVVVTDSGVENFTHFLPMELDDMEKLVREKGIVQWAPPQR